MFQKFSKIFGHPPAGMIRSPGRVNLIGDHTDYNDGFVLPMAIDRHIQLMFSKNRDRRVVLFSTAMDTPLRFSLDSLHRQPGHWGEYVKGVADVLQKNGYRLHGWNGLLASDIPVGSGLSSSAALEIAGIEVFQAVSGFSLDVARKALMGQMAENNWVGVPCGIMDPLVCAGGRKGHALLIDCRSMIADPVPLSSGTVVAILDTGTRRKLADSAYHRRRRECEAAARHFGLPALRDLTRETLESPRFRLDSTLYRRARHVVDENQRVLAMARALKNGNAPEAGTLMNQSHESLRDDFEVSAPALDAMVESARGHDGCLGARMTGAGFGGCAVALVRQDLQDAFVQDTADKYRGKTGIEPAVFICRAAAGAGAMAAE